LPASLHQSNLYFLFSISFSLLSFYVTYKCCHDVEGACSICEETARQARIACEHNWSIVYNDGNPGLTGVACDFGDPHSITASQDIAHTCDVCHAVACVDCYTG